MPNERTALLELKDLVYEHLSDKSLPEDLVIYRTLLNLYNTYKKESKSLLIGANSPSGEVIDRAMNKAGLLHRNSPPTIQVLQIFFLHSLKLNTLQQKVRI